MKKKVAKKFFFPRQTEDEKSNPKPIPADENEYVIMVNEEAKNAGGLGEFHINGKPMEGGPFMIKRPN